MIHEHNKDNLNNSHRGRINSKMPKAYRFLTSLILESDDAVLNKKFISSSKRNLKLSNKQNKESEDLSEKSIEPFLPAEFYRDLLERANDNPDIYTNDNTRVKSNKKDNSSSFSAGGSKPDSTDNTDSNIDSLIGFSKETENDLVTNVVTSLCKNTHMLIYQEDEWGEYNTIQLLNKASNMTNSKLISIDIPDWSAICADLGEDFQELTIVSYPYIPSPSLNLNNLIKMNVFSKGEDQLKKNEKDQYDNDENENDIDNDDLENDEEYASSESSQKKINHEKLWFEVENLDKNTDSSISTKKKISACPALPADFIQSPLSQSETKLLDDRLMELIESKYIFTNSSSTQQSLIIVVKHLGDLLNTRIGYTLFSRLLICAQNFNVETKSKYYREISKLQAKTLKSEYVRGPTMIAGLMHPSIFNPDIAPPTLPPFDSNPSAPSAIKNQLIDLSKFKIDNSFSLDGYQTRFKTLSSNKEASATGPLVFAISSFGSKSQPIFPKLLATSIADSTRKQGAIDSLSKYNSSEYMPIGSSLFTRIALPSISSQYFTTVTSISRQWYDMQNSELKTIKTILSMRQKSILEQIYTRNANILRNILILLNVRNINFTGSTVKKTSTRDSDTDILGSNYYISKYKVLELLKQIPGDLAGRLFLSETFLHRLVNNAIGLCVIDKFQILSKGTIETSKSKTKGAHSKKRVKKNGFLPNDIFMEKMVIESKYFIKAWLEIVASYQKIGDSAYFSPINRAISIGSYTKSSEFLLSSSDNESTLDKSNDNNANFFISNTAPYEAKPYLGEPIDSIGIFIKDKLSIDINPKHNCDLNDTNESSTQNLQKDIDGDKDFDGTGSSGILHSSENNLQKDDVSNIDDQTQPNKHSASAISDKDSKLNNFTENKQFDQKISSDSQTAIRSSSNDVKATGNIKAVVKPTEDFSEVDLDSETLKRLSLLKKTELNSYEKRLLSCIVDPKSIPSGFINVCAKSETIITLQELISLPLLCPELFGDGVLGKHSISGLLLFGPPGTGKTMLAKAVAKESGSLVLNIKSSDVYDKYVGEGEKIVKAIFSLARRISPCVVFIDEVDALFGARGNDQSQGYKREIINQFMAEWDGLTSIKSGSKKPKIMVLAATNRPFDLDDAILRRLPRRILVDLPDETERSKIIKLHLKDEEIGDDVDIDAIAKKAKLYSGSDLKNLCIAGALSAVREKISAHLSTYTKNSSDNLDNCDLNLDQNEKIGKTLLGHTNETEELEKSQLEQEKGKKVKLDSDMLMKYIKELRIKRVMLQKSKNSNTKNSSISDTSSSKLVIYDRHFESGFKMVSSSCSDDMTSISELHKWNEKYGDNAKTRKNKIVLGFDNSAKDLKK
ncbi:hypothetical protein BB561_001373 [Smittium simulii]|uniref:AAA+ ATPase domain-containing protein n=1 Tax=Smittium simulii TaxID=133385 RepID=A0A2T9YUW6_9FUNG|nr:hypothetical protein BB561_001373 [Smittium simulii]